MQKNSIFVIEDDDDIRHLVTAILTKAGFIVASARSAESALKRIPSVKPSLILLDFELPNMDGLECCKRIRADSISHLTPVILVSVHNSEVYKIAALEAGADDFVTKPFSHGELVARIRAVLRRSNSVDFSRENEFTDHLFKLNRDSRTVILDGHKLELSPKEYELLDLLVRAGGRVVTRDVISVRIWEHENLANSRTIDVHIARLRRKLGNAYRDVIQTAGKFGYCYRIPVKETGLQS